MKVQRVRLGITYYAKVITVHILDIQIKLVVLVTAVGMPVVIRTIVEICSIEGRRVGPGIGIGRPSLFGAKIRRQ